MCTVPSSHPLSLLGCRHLSVSALAHFLRGNRFRFRTWITRGWPKSPAAGSPASVQNAARNAVKQMAMISGRRMFGSTRSLRRMDSELREGLQDRIPHESSHAQRFLCLAARRFWNITGIANLDPIGVEQSHAFDVDGEGDIHLAN